jgi:flagellar assembly protein FliH
MTASSKPAAKASAHSRFIPREEIGAFAAWTFSAMDSADEPPAPAAEPAPPEAATEAATLHDAREAAFAEGFAEGQASGALAAREALEAPLREAAEATAQRMEQLLDGMREQLLRSEDLLARQLLELACDLARQVVRQELRSHPQHLQPVLAEALGQLVDDHLPVTVRLHPDDLAPLQAALRDTANPPAFVADASLSPGGCLVESPAMAVDATVEKRWARAIGNLGLDAPWSTPAC